MTSNTSLANTTEAFYQNIYTVEIQVGNFFKLPTMTRDLHADRYIFTI